MVVVDFHDTVTLVGRSPAAPKMAIEEIRLLAVHFGAVLVMVVAVEDRLHVWRVLKQFNHFLAFDAVHGPFGRGNVQEHENAFFILVFRKLVP